MVDLTVNVKGGAGLVHQCKLQKMSVGMMCDFLEADDEKTIPEALKRAIQWALDQHVTRSVEITIELDEPYPEMLAMVKEQCGVDPGEFVRQILLRAAQRGVDTIDEPLAMAS